MAYETVEKVLNAFHKNKAKTLLILFVLFLAFIITSYLNGWLGEKAKQHATSSNAPNINQKTTGDQSPAINTTDGNINIQYKD